MRKTGSDQLYFTHSMIEFIFFSLTWVSKTIGCLCSTSLSSLYPGKDKIYKHKQEDEQNTIISGRKLEIVIENATAFSDFSYHIAEAYTQKLLTA